MPPVIPILASFLLSCGSSPILVADPELWEPVPLAEDPFVPPAGTPACAGWRLAQGELVLDPDECPWWTVTQPSFLSFMAGDRITSRIEWSDWEPDSGSDDGNADTGSTTGGAEVVELVLVLDNIQLWRHRLPLPAEAEVIALDVVLDRAVAVNSPLMLHVESSGQGQLRWGPLFRE